MQSTSKDDEGFTLLGEITSRGKFEGNGNDANISGGILDSTWKRKKRRKKMSGI